MPKKYINKEYRQIIKNVEYKVKGQKRPLCSEHVAYCEYLKLVMKKQKTKSIGISKKVNEITWVQSRFCRNE